MPKQERFEASLEVVNDLAKWPHHNYKESDFNDDAMNVSTGATNSFNYVLISAIRDQKIPPTVTSRYAWQSTCRVITDLAQLGTWEERTDYCDEILGKKPKMQTATDGSAGQARAWLNAQKRYARWLTGSMPMDVLYCTECNRAPLPHEDYCVHDAPVGREEPAEWWGEDDEVGNLGTLNEAKRR